MIPSAPNLIDLPAIIISIQPQKTHDHNRKNRDKAEEAALVKSKIRKRLLDKSALLN